MPQESVENRVNHRKYLCFVVNKVEMGENFLRLFWLSYVSIIPQGPIHFPLSTTDAIYPNLSN
jgi:hypothetical protein